MPSPSKAEKPIGDEELFDLLAQAQQQYDRYLELARVAGFTELIAQTQAQPQPPEEDVPLSLTIWPDE